jgi:hypothetical protein
MPPPVTVIYKPTHRQPSPDTTPRSKITPISLLGQVQQSKMTGSLQETLAGEKDLVGVYGRASRTKGGLAVIQ